MAKRTQAPGLPAPTATELDAAFDALECWIREQPAGMVSNADLHEYERRVWDPKWRFEKRKEANRLFMFCCDSGRVRSVHVIATDATGIPYPFAHRKFSSQTWFALPDLEPWAPAGYLITGINPANAGLAPSEDHGQRCRVQCTGSDGSVRFVYTAPRRRTVAECLALRFVELAIPGDPCNFTARRAATMREKSESDS